MSYEDDYEAARARVAHIVERGQLHVLTPRNTRWTARRPGSLTWWLGYALHQPREFAYVAPRRIACRLGQHNPTCIGRAAPHPRRW
ncbi:hypothetical protein [Streptomyces graminilatus]|uniref:hypothetical protein n=1 Tax=Streptomyces graminilatus TaxID=1464070 RepID=UPI0006E2DCC7|nr:hypothetical protein [Streptomyces graminilatus]